MMNITKLFLLGAAAMILSACSDGEAPVGMGEGGGQNDTGGGSSGSGYTPSRPSIGSCAGSSDPSCSSYLYGSLLGDGGLASINWQSAIAPDFDRKQGAAAITKAIQTCAKTDSNQLKDAACFKGMASGFIADANNQPTGARCSIAYEMDAAAGKHTLAMADYRPAALKTANYAITAVASPQTNASFTAENGTQILYALSSEQVLVDVIDPNAPKAYRCVVDQYQFERTKAQSAQ